MKNYLITLAEVEAPPKAIGASSRRELYDSWAGAAQDFRSSLLAWLAKSKLNSQVMAVGSPTGFGVIGITCTPLVAEEIEQLKGVESVLEDA